MEMEATAIEEFDLGPSFVPSSHPFSIYLSDLVHHTNLKVRSFSDCENQFCTATLDKQYPGNLLKRTISHLLDVVEATPHLNGLHQPADLSPLVTYRMVSM